MEESISRLRDITNRSGNIVFFGGAGVSTESGIPDFRGTGGLYYQVYEYPPETILSHSFFMNHPEEFYRFYREKMLVRDAVPNHAHHKLAEWERVGKLSAVITQNIDGLHQAAGSSRVLELHGNANRLYCISCGKQYTAAILDETEGVPRCGCGGIIKPDVVLYEERLDDSVMDEAVSRIRRCETLIIGGTSLSVYPAAGLVNYYNGDSLVLINIGATPYDARADLLINARIGEVFASI